MNHGFAYSWTAKTLILMGAGGTQTSDHPHAAFVWVSKDDGETCADARDSPLQTQHLLRVAIYRPLRHTQLPCAKKTTTLVQSTLDHRVRPRWTDETGSASPDGADIVSMGPGVSNWYENDLYLNSMGQGIMVKTLEDSEW